MTSRERTVEMLEACGRYQVTKELPVEPDGVHVIKKVKNVIGNTPGLRFGSMWRGALTWGEAQPTVVEEMSMNMGGACLMTLYEDDAVLARLKPSGEDVSDPPLEQEGFP